MFKKPEIEKISPNFINEASKLAEQRLRTLVEKARVLGVEIFSLKEGKEEILEQIKQNFLQRYDLVVEKLRQEGLKPVDLPKDVLIDRMLGIDMLFTFLGKNYAVDVTSGKSTVVLNKKNKFQEMQSLYNQLGIDRALVIRLKKDITEDAVINIFAKLEELELNKQNESFSIVIKYPKPNLQNKKI